MDGAGSVAYLFCFEKRLLWPLLSCREVAVPREAISLGQLAGGRNGEAGLADQARARTPPPPAAVALPPSLAPCPPTCLEAGPVHSAQMFVFNKYTKRLRACVCEVGGAGKMGPSGGLALQKALPLGHRCWWGWPGRPGGGRLRQGGSPWFTVPPILPSGIAPGPLPLSLHLPIHLPPLSLLHPLLPMWGLQWPGLGCLHVMEGTGRASRRRLKSVKIT